MSKKDEGKTIGFFELLAEDRTFRWCMFAIIVVLSMFLLYIGFMIGAKGVENLCHEACTCPMDPPKENMFADP